MLKISTSIFGLRRKHVLMLNQIGLFGLLHFGFSSIQHLFSLRATSNSLGMLFLNTCHMPKKVQKTIVQLVLHVFKCVSYTSLNLKKGGMVPLPLPLASARCACGSPCPCEIAPACWQLPWPAKLCQAVSRNGKLDMGAASSFSLDRSFTCQGLYGHAFARHEIQETTSFVQEKLLQVPKHFP